MDDQFYTPKQLSQLLQVSKETLREWHQKGKLQAITTKGGHRRYLYNHENPQTPSNNTRKGIIYCRVSSSKQKPDLQRQILFLQQHFPSFEVIKDIGSGINFKRKGLQRLLEQIMSGTVSKVVVAHRDRLCRFGFELFEQVFKRFNTRLEVFRDESIKEPVSELGQDLLSIITVFTARYYGARKYKILQEDKNLPKPGTKIPIQKVYRSVKVLLQSNNKSSKQLVKK